MRTLVAVLVALTVLTPSKPIPANFLKIVVSGRDSAMVRVIWFLYAGAVRSRGEDQQARLKARRAFENADSLRRWHDPKSRDTLLIKIPAELIVDMSPGSVVIQAVRDSILVEAQLTPRRGDLIKAWGRVLIVDSNGITPSVTRKR